MTTIKDVAKKANVSVATVSRIINNLPGYTEETKVRVLKAIQELDYTKNAIAQGLVNKKTNTIGVLIPCLSSKFASELLWGIESAAHSLEQSVIICNTDSNGHRTMKYLKMLREKRVDGIIFVSEWLKDEYASAIDEMKVPVVLISTYSDRYQIPFVRLDDRKAAYHATEYLIKKGHRYIGMISGSEDDPIAGYPRISGYKQALKDNGVPFTVNLLAFGDFHYKSGIAAMEKLIEKVPEITAVFAASDEMAVGAIKAINKRGRKVPDDISVMGYDDTQDAEMAIPQLTTIHQPLLDMGKIAVDLLFSSDKAGSGIIMPHSIVERESVREV